MRTRLIIVEGIPGAGKTTTAAFIKGFLETNHIPARLHTEGDLNHPADFESVACLSAAIYDELFQKYIQNRMLLEKHTIRKCQDYLVSYGKIKSESGPESDNGMIGELKQYDIYDGEVSSEKYCSLCQQKWREFVEEALKDNRVTIFECCFLQNPTVALLGRHNAAPPFITRYITALGELIKPLNTFLIYLYRGDVRQTLEAVSRERPRQWLDFVIEYTTKQGYGLANRLSGFDGLVRFLEVRRELELEIIKQLDFPIQIIDNSNLNREQCHKEIMKQLIC